MLSWLCTHMTNTNNKIYCFLGLPGSGKGTQIEILSKKLDASVISIGEEIREELESADFNDPFYKTMKSLYDQGVPQPDEVVVDIVKKRLQRINNHIIFDNFPFSHNQADLFFSICKELNVSVPELIVIDITPETSIRRIVYRKVCADCAHISSDTDVEICEKCGGAMVTRADDNEETVKERIKNYLPRIKEVENYFANFGAVHIIDGNGTIEEVANLVQEKIK